MLHVRSGTVSAAGSRANGGVLDAPINITARTDASFELNVVDATLNPIEGDDAHISITSNGVKCKVSLSVLILNFIFVFYIFQKSDWSCCNISWSNDSSKQNIEYFNHNNNNNRKIIYKGRYHVVFPLTVTGDNLIAILVNEQPIANSMNHLIVIAAAASNATTTVRVFLSAFVNVNCFKYYYFLGIWSRFSIHYQHRICFVLKILFVVFVQD